MLVYSTILLVSLVLAAISIFLYRTVVNSNRSIYSSRAQVGTILETPHHQKNKVVSHAVAGAAKHPDPTDQVLSWPSAKQPHGHGTGVGKVSRCSLFDVNATNPETGYDRAPPEEEHSAAGATPGHTRGCSLYSA